MSNKITYLFRMFMIFFCIMMMAAAFAENPASENYILKQSNFLAENNPQTSTNYILQSSSIDIVSGDEVESENHKILPGYYHGEMLAGILVPENVTISIDGENVLLTWDLVPAATSYKVYSSNDPVSGFTEDSSGSFVGESWSTPVPSGKKFYYVKSIK